MHRTSRTIHNGVYFPVAESSLTFSRAIAPDYPPYWEYRRHAFHGLECWRWKHTFLYLSLLLV